MLEVKELQASYGDSRVLHSFNLTIPPGGRVALLGRNGAGKSTLLKSLMGAGPIVRGSIQWNGHDLTGLTPHDRARLGIAFVPEDRRILGGLTVTENLRMALTGTPVHRRTASPEQIIKQFTMLEPIRHRHGGLLSGGQQQILALARAAIVNPTLLLLDEPTEGLAPVIVEAMVHDVKRICQNGCALLLCEQSLWVSRKCTDFVYVLDSGRLVFSGTWEEFDADEGVKRRHLAVA